MEFIEQLINGLNLGSIYAIWQTAKNSQSLYVPRTANKLSIFQICSMPKSISVLFI